MNCAEREPLLNAQVDGQLSPDVELDAHLRDCAACRGRVDALREQHARLEAAFAPARIDAAALASRIAASYEAPAKRRPWLLFGVAAAAGMLLALLLPRTPPPPPERVVVKAVDPREQAAWTALEAVHAYARLRPQDHAGFVGRCVELAGKHPGTAAAEAARRSSADSVQHTCATPNELPALADLKGQIVATAAKAAALEEIQRELARLDETVNLPAARERFADARRLLDEARARRAEPLWTAEVDRRRTLLDSRLAAQGDACIAAAKAGDAKAHRERVAGWGVPDALARFDRDVGPVVEPKAPPSAAPAPSVRLLASTGELLLKGPAPQKGDRLPLPQFVATREGVLCSFETEAGHVLRVNVNTQLEIDADGKVTLWEGECFARLQEGGPALEISAGGRRVTARNAILEISQRQGRAVKGPARSAFRVTVLQGEVKLDDRVVPAGQVCRVANGIAEPSEPADDVALSTQWMHPLLRGRREDRGELTARGRALAGLLDDPKAGKAAEGALRGLGADAAPGLLSLLGDGKGVDGAHRRRLAGLLADLAGPERAGDLIELLRDHEPAVRTEAARGLERMTGLTQGHPRSLWAGSGYERGAQSWDAWLDRQGPPWGASVPVK